MLFEVHHSVVRYGVLRLRSASSLFAQDDKMLSSGRCEACQIGKRRYVPTAARIMERPIAQRLNAKG